VQAALDAGARYADVRVMHRGLEMLSARNGDIEAVAHSADSGIGVRALVGSGWGFYATADLDDRNVREAGARSAEIAAASALVARDESALLPATATTGSWAARHVPRPSSGCSP